MQPFIRHVEFTGRLALTLLCALFGLPATTGGQEVQLQWARTYRVDPAKDNHATAISASQGAIIAAGTAVNAAGNSDYTVISYNESGGTNWVRMYDSTPGANDVMRAMAVDANGNVFVTGTTDTVKYNQTGLLIWKVPFGGRAVIADTNFVYVTGFSETDFVTVQLQNNDVDGRQNWLRTYNGVGNDEDISGALTFTKNGEVIVAGWETLFRESNGYPVDCLSAVRYDTNGVQVWYGRGNMYPAFPNEQKICAVKVDGGNAVYALGKVGSNAILMRLNADGSHAWTKRLLTTDVASMGVTSDNGAISIGYGYITGTTIGGSVTRHTSSGTVLWGNSNTITNAYLQDLLITPLDESYIVGFIQTSSAETDMLIVKVGSDGKELNRVLYGFENQRNDFATAIAKDSAGNIYVAGYSSTPEGGSEFVTLKYGLAATIKAQPSGAMHLEFHTNPNQEFAIEATSNFFNWQSLITNTADANGLVQFNDTDAPAVPYRFYRGKQP